MGLCRAIECNREHAGQYGLDVLAKRPPSIMELNNTCKSGEVEEGVILERNTRGALVLMQDVLASKYFVQYLQLKKALLGSKSRPCIRTSVPHALRSRLTPPCTITGCGMNILSRVRRFNWVLIQ